MTEAEWFACNNPEDLRDFIKEKLGQARGERISSRKKRLLGVACCRRLSRLLIDERSCAALDVAEDYADGRATSSELEAAHAAALEVAQGGASRRAVDQSMRNGTPADPHILAQVHMAWAAAHTSELSCYFSHEDTERATVCDDWGDGGTTHKDAACNVTRVAEAHVFRDIFGSFFHRAQLDGSWLDWNDGAIRKMAQAIYDERAFDRLPILADALEEAGCTDIAILAHCRELGEHVRGCWVVDLLLDKT